MTTASALVVALAVLLQGPGQGAPACVTVSSPEGNFSVAMPAKPTTSSRSLKAPQGSVEELIYSCRVGDAYYSVQRVSPSLRVAAGTEAAELRRQMESYEQSTGGKVVGRGPRTLDGHHGLEVTIEAPGPTGSSIRSLPSSKSRITEGVVATTLVREAASKMVSAVIGTRFGIRKREPYAFR